MIRFFNLVFILSVSVLILYCLCLWRKRTYYYRVLSAVFTACAEEVGEQCNDGGGISWRQEHMDTAAWRTHWTPSGEWDPDVDLPHRCRSK